MKRLLFSFAIILSAVLPLNAADRGTVPDPSKESEQPKATTATQPAGRISCADVPMKPNGSVDMLAYGEKVGSMTPAPHPTGDTPDCPAVVHCPASAGCDRCHGINCSDVDTGEADCLLTPTVLFHCSSGTIHIHPCNECEGLCTVGHACTDAYSQTWDCE